MRKEPNFEIFHQAFSWRAEAASALTGSLEPTPHDFEHLKIACLKLEEIISQLGQGDVEDQYRAYHTAISIFVILAEWKHAIRNAEPDSQRFLNSAKLRASEVDKSFKFTTDERLKMFLGQVESLQNMHELTVIQNQLKQWSLPLPLFANPQDRSFEDFRVPNLEEPEKFETTVAFLKFDIDGEPAKHWNYLKPGTYYDLTIEVRVANWPTHAHVLSLTPITVDSREQDWLPSFRFEKPEGNDPFIFTGTSRAILEVAHSFGSRPYEFLYAVEFDDTSNCRDVAVVGHRRLLLEGSDVASNPLTGFSSVDRHLLSIRNKLRNFPGLHPDDVANTMLILGGLGNIAAQALKQGLFETGTSERQFQNKVSEMLQNRNDIGKHLQGHPEAAGGITDLTFRDIPIELKVENSKVLFPKDFSKFFNQTAAYAIGLGKRIGVLSILESSRKSAPVGVVENDIEIFPHQTGQSTIVIVVVVIRGGFPKPSSYSK
ncbi:hypothetical protein IQ225_18390 [Synechocystis salina LEGE 06155]|uniref:hypothetical protein n=1 Tax=Synechocystis sp. LEGE 06083 TaxID=915336 RepID=UPI00187DDD96|nr:hypothetical protein [Synechocystis sp. LEGE 06083]MBE9176795.1 hypothetical protein [Synechocystis salina LEGE 06155]MBE9195490.1 hypothetical protein [Synechocystis sp. LEGE 06083]